MKRFFVLVILFCFAIGLFTPYIKGLVLRHEIKKSVKELNDHLTEYRPSGSIRSVAINQYKTRYLNSDIEWVVKAPGLESWFDTDGIILNDRVTHTLAHKVVSQTSLEKNMEYKAWVDRYLNGKDPLIITTEYFLSGDIKSSVSMDGFTYKKGINTIHVKPATLAFEFYKSSDQVVLNLSWGGIDIPGVRQIDPLRVVTRMEKKGDIWKGTARFNVNGFRLYSRKNHLALTQLTGRYGLMVDEKKSMISMDLSADIKSGSSQMWNFSMARGNLSLHNLDTEGFYQFIRLSRDSNKAIFKSMISSESDPHLQERIVKKALKKTGSHIVEVYEKFLRKGLKIHLNKFHVTVPEGEIIADVSLALKKRITVTGLIPVLLKPSLVLDLLSLKSDIRIPYDLIVDSAALTTPFFKGMKTGLFVSLGQTLEHHAEIRENGFWLNNKAVELPK